MEYKRFICPNCGASIDFVANQTEVTCEYCGSKFSTGIKVQPNAEQNGYDFEKGRQRAMMEQRPIYNTQPQQPVKKYNYLWLWILGWTCFFPIPLTVLIWKSQKLDNKWKTGLTVALWAFLLLWGKIGGSNSLNRTNDSSGSQVSMEFSAYELKGKNYDDVKTKFEVAGFSNIVMEPVETTDDSQSGKVIESSVNGDTDFYIYQSYPQDAKVVIRYYIVKNKTTEYSTEVTTEKTIEHSNKKEKNGFDEGKNNSFIIYGYKYSIPEYFGNMAGTSKENSRNFYAERGDSVTMLNISCDELDCTQEEFNGVKDQLMNNLLKGIDDVIINSSNDVEIAGCSGRNFVFSSNINNIDMIGDFYFFYSQKNKKVIIVGLAQSINSKYDYIGDFTKVVESIENTNEPDDVYESKNEAERTSEQMTEISTETISKLTTEATTEVTTEATTEKSNESVYEYAYSRVYSDYTICYLIDTDAKECIMFMTSDGYGYYGQYTGDLSSQIIVNYPREGYSDTITFQNGIGSNADVRIGNDTITFEFKSVSVDSIEKYLKSINKD